MTQTWVIAVGLLLILEGVGPLAFPGMWRQAFEYLTRLTDGQIRFMGLLALLAGLALIGIA